MKSRRTAIIAIIILTIVFSGTLQSAPGQGIENSGKQNKGVSQEIEQLLGNMRGPQGTVAEEVTLRATRTAFKKGHLRSIGAPKGHAFPVSNVVAGDPRATANNFINEQRKAFGADNASVDFAHKKSKVRNGQIFERFRQTYSGIPVFGGEMIIQLNDEGGVQFVLSDIMTETGDLDAGKVSMSPGILAEDVVFLAVELMAAEHPTVQLNNTEPQLMIYEPEVIGNSGSTQLVWYTVVKSVPAYVVNEVILIDAHTGETALRYSQIMHARNREIYDVDGDDAAPGTLERAEGDPPSGIVDVDDAYDYLGDTYDFYLNEHGRDGIDDAGLLMIARVRYTFANAFWNGSEMLFGLGFAVDDVTSHELTHGVTQYESNLIYQNESGAINESFSDMWGEWVDLTNTGGNDDPSVRWLLGEDVPGFGAIRDMADPTTFGDPDSKCSPLWYEGPADNGGVHWNSGVGNKLCYLLTDGDTFNDVEIEGMGISAVADLMYECQTTLLTEASGYVDLHVALTQAAINLGWSDEERWNVEKACLVTELSKCFDPADLIQGIFPNPMEWAVEPIAVGETTIYMKAVTATHASGVEYYIDCETALENFEEGNGLDWYGDPQFDSNNGQPVFPTGWVSDTTHYRGDYDTGSEYYFRVRARNLENGEETQWSEIIGPITPVSGLPPHPNPAQWAGTPRKASNGRIAMEAVEGYAEAVLIGEEWASEPVEYFFDCIDTDDPLFAGPDDLDSEWQSSTYYQRTVSPISEPGTFYEFNLKMRVNGVETDVDPNNLRTAYMAPAPITREVPTPAYPTIQEAIDKSNHGDTVLVHQGVHHEINIDFKGKAITVRSENPEDPAIVAATVIDCAEVVVGGGGSEWLGEHRRAFLIQNGEGRDTVLAGITIKNAITIDNHDSGAVVSDARDALGGAILIGRLHVEEIVDPIFGYIINTIEYTVPASPTIRNCVFENCFAYGVYGYNGGNGGSPTDNPGSHGGKGGDGGNAYGGAIYVYQGATPLFKECQFTNCQAIGGNAGDGGNGGNGGGHSNGAPDGTPGWRGGDGGDAGKGGCAWGGAIYFEPNCLPELYDVTISSCFVKVGEAGQGGDAGDGSGSKGPAFGGHGGNGGLGGDLRAPDSSGGAVYFGENTDVVIDGCVFEDCYVDAMLSGDYSGGDGGNGGGGGQGFSGGAGGHGGPAYFIPPKMVELGGVNATGGTGGNGGGGAPGGNGGFRMGVGGAPGGQSFTGNPLHTGIFPSNIYYMAYYWEDTMNIHNPTDDPNDHYPVEPFEYAGAFAYDWEWELIPEYFDFLNFNPYYFYYDIYDKYNWDWDPNLLETVIEIPDPIDPNTVIGTYDRQIYTYMTLFDSPFSPYYGFLGQLTYVDPTVTILPDPNNPGQSIIELDYDFPIYIYPVSASVKPLTPTNPDQRSTGACGGANFYGENCTVVMRDTTISGNNSFANHGGAELYDKGCDVEFDNCIFENNQTQYETPAVETDFRYEGYGGAIYADQPVRFVFNECEFIENNAYSGGALYCNFAPSDPNSLLDPEDPNYVEPPKLELTECTFTGNLADKHFLYSYGGALYAGNSLESYEEYFFNYLKDYRYTNAEDYIDLFWGDPIAVDRFITFFTQFYDHYHASYLDPGSSDPGLISFWHPITTQLWNDELEADHILWGTKDPVYSVTMTDCLFEENLAPYGGGLCLDASVVDITQSQFHLNTGQVGAGGYVFASDMLVQNNIFHENIGAEIVSLGTQSEQDNATVDMTGNGGGLYVSNSNLDMINNSFTANVVDGFAGAVFVNGPSLDWYPQYLVNNLFVQNVAGLQGGALVASGASDVFIQNSNFIDNSIADFEFGVGGALLAHDAFVDIVNSIFWSTEDFYPGAPLGPQIAVGDPYEEVQEYDPDYIPYTTVFVEYSDVQGSEAGVFVADGEGPWLWYGSNNIEDDPTTVDIDEADPQFAAIYDPINAIDQTFYLSQVDPNGLEPLQEALFEAGQNNPCVNAGFGTVSDLAALVGFNISTRTDHEEDIDEIDIGYHYDASLPVEEYTLRAGVYIADLFRHGELEVGTPSLTKPVPVPDDPNTTTFVYQFKQGTVVELVATPEDLDFTPEKDYRVARWIGSDDDFFNYEETNTITMTGYETVQVEFELAVPRNLYVPGAYVTIEDAMVAARHDDTIILDPRPGDPYLIANPDGISFEGKRVVITSLDPNDPNIVASTVIDVQGSTDVSKRAFHFESGEGPDSIIQGVTIRNAFTAVIGLDGVIETGRWPWWFGPAPPEPWTEDPENPSPLPPFRALSGEDAIGDSYGGAILIENGSSPVIRNCVFDNCIVSGAIGGDGLDGFWQDPLDGITEPPEGNWDGVSGGHGGTGFGNGYGGAIAVMSGSSPHIFDCKFTNNGATGGWGGTPGNGGTAGGDGRYSWGGNAGNGIGDGRGGAIYVTANCNAQLHNNIFEGNYSSLGQVSPFGGLPGAGEEYPEPFDLAGFGLFRNGFGGFAQGNGALAGGAIFLEQGANFVLDTSTFNNNTASIGGAVYAEPNVVLEIHDSNFLNHTGGAVYISSNADLEISDSQFLNNVGSQAAGGVTIGIDAIAASIADCNFVSNSTAGDGGAIQTSSGITVENSEFIANTASSDGGAFYAYSPPDPNVNTLQVQFQDCEFQSNTAQGFGGVGFAKNCILRMEDCNLIYNKAVSGGALRVPSGELLEMERCLVFGNVATGTTNGSDGHGGGVHVIDGSFNIYDSRFENNKARGPVSAGGGLCIAGSQTYFKQNLKNCLFATNDSKNTGGGIACIQYVNLKIDNCTIADNASSGQGGGVYLDYTSSVNIENSIVSSNVGCGIYERRPNCQSVVDSTLFYANWRGDLYDAQTNQTISGKDALRDTAGYTNILDDDPQYVTGPWGVYYLTQLSNPNPSPAVDAGSETAVEAMLDMYTTDSAGMLDQGDADWGYHYSLPEGIPEFELTASVLNDRWGTVSSNRWGMEPPPSNTYLRLATAQLEAVADPNYRVARWVGTDDDNSFKSISSVLMFMDQTVQVEFERNVPKNLYVPESYDTLEEAMQLARDGDRIILAPRAQPHLIFNPGGINFGGKQIHLRSTDPDNPDVVASTVLDCQGSRYASRRAFVFNNGEDQNTIIEGITIRNAFTAKIGLSAAISTGMWPWYDGIEPESWFISPPDPLPPVRALSGMDSTGDSYGGAILCENGSSPVIRKCVFENCTVAGGIGGDGADGFPSAGLTDVDIDIDAQSGGHSGKGTGNGYGGAIAVTRGSDPIIYKCEFRNNAATGGWGGIPGNAGASYNGGRYGWGGNDFSGLSWVSLAEILYPNTIVFYPPVIDENGAITFPVPNNWFEAGYGEGDGQGGAIYVEAGCDPAITECRFVGNYSRNGYASAGGAESTGSNNAYPEPFDADDNPGIAWGDDGMRAGRAGAAIDYGNISGGAVFFGADVNSLMVEAKLIDCEFIGNSAYSAGSFFGEGTVEEFPTYTRGGAVQVDPNAFVRIEDCEFIENIPGALYCSVGATLNVENCDFTNNSTFDPNTVADETLGLILFPILPEIDIPGVSLVGGAVTFDFNVKFDPSRPSINNCRFTGNMTDQSGGAILTYSELLVSNSEFNANSAQSDGGAFYCYYDTGDPNHPYTISLEFDNCEFSGNESQGLGGAGYVKTGILKMQGCFFVQNTAFSGGAIYTTLSDYDMTGGLMYGNIATGLIEGRHRPIVDEGFGGGLMVVDGEVSIKDARILNNVAQGIYAGGGGVCITGGQTYHGLSMENCLLAGNTSASNGGGLSLRKYVSMYVDSCTFADNSSAEAKGGGIYVDETSEVWLRNSIVSGNTGYGIYEKLLSDAGESDADYSLFYGNELGDLFDAQTEKPVSGSDDLISVAGYGDHINLPVDDILDGNPQFADGPLDGYYLTQTSPAVDAGNVLAADAMLGDPDPYTTDPEESSSRILDQGWLDLGYHYDDFLGVNKYTLEAQVQDGAGEMKIWDKAIQKWVDFESEEFYRGEVVVLRADVSKEYFLTGWSGGTVNDNSEEADNLVLITTRGKTIEAKVRLRKTLTVGASSEYDTLGDAIDDAQDGDMIFIVPGQYTSASQYPSALTGIVLDGKKLTISGSNPDDESVVRATVFNSIDFILSNLDEKTVIEGITLTTSNMSLTDASPTIRNCVFTENHFFRLTPVHVGNPIPDGADGYPPYPIYGGAMSMINSSPKVVNCTFENNSVTGGNAEDGFEGGGDHPNGGDGGWPGAAYGGAVYCGMYSKPEFDGCTFTGNEVFGGNGGNGADFVTVDNVDWYGGRGGGWVYDEAGEAYLTLLGWDGWAYEGYGDKYTFWSIYAPYYGEIDFELWTEWFSWSDAYSSWDDFFNNYYTDIFGIGGDPYDQMMDPWRYSGLGGAVYCELASGATFTDCTFEANQSHGGLTGVGGVQPFTGVPWPDRQLNMPTAGGAVFAVSDSDVEFENCTFLNNIADKSTVELPHTYEVSYGGAVAYEFGCEVKFTNCDIQENNATVGGGIYGYHSEATIADCNLFNNEAYLGAGAFLDDISSVISGTLVHANRAKSPDSTTVPGENPDDPPIVVDSPIDLTGQGAGIYAHVLDIQIRDSMFVENKADLSGGGLLLSGTVDEAATIFNCLFTENTAGRDGAGASVNWANRVEFGNCTFSDNSVLGVFREVETGEFEFLLDDEGLPILDDEGNPILIPVTTLVQDFPGSGGGLSVSYDSISDVNDGIFWNNQADQGESIYVGTSPEYERPSVLTISNSLVGNYPSANAIYVEEECILDVSGGNIFSDNPDFVRLPDAEIDDVTLRYYLDQQTSSAIDAGSGFASDIGLPERALSEYTTSVLGVIDRGIVDLGFHYRQAPITSCRRADLTSIPNGIIDLEDLAIFASWWLSFCGEGNTWCDGADQNFDTEVNFEDYVNIARCWQETDEEPPFPDPAEWEVEPMAPLNTFDSITMTASLHHDLWFPDDALQYYFDCITPLDGPDSGWISDREWTVTTADGLDPRYSYTYVVSVKDPLDNETENSDPATAMPGENTELPAGEWLNPPFVMNAEFAIGMEADTYDLNITDYVIQYQFWGTGPAADRDYGLSPFFVDENVIAGETYSYRTRLGLFYDTGDGLLAHVQDGDWSVEAFVVATEPDLYPPIPNPALHMTGSPEQSFNATEGVYYHVVTAVQAEDVINAAGDTLPVNENVEYKFVNLDNDYYSSGNDGDPAGIEWRNVDNVALLFNPDGLGITPQVPEQYWARRGVSTAQSERWYIIVRDRTPNQNTTWHKDYLPPEPPQGTVEHDAWQLIIDTVNVEIRDQYNKAP